MYKQDQRHSHQTPESRTLTTHHTTTHKHTQSYSIMIPFDYATIVKHTNTAMPTNAIIHSDRLGRCSPSKRRVISNQKKTEATVANCTPAPFANAPSWTNKSHGCLLNAGEMSCCNGTRKNRINIARKPLGTLAMNHGANNGRKLSKKHWQRAWNKLCAPSTRLGRMLLGE